jgi:hypothetical protein
MVTRRSSHNDDDDDTITNNKETRFFSLIFSLVLLTISTILIPVMCIATSSLTLGTTILAAIRVSPTALSKKLKNKLHSLRHSSSFLSSFFFFFFLFLGGHAIRVRLGSGSAAL